MRVVLATANRDKAAEMAAILGALDGVELLERPGELADVAETGATLEENAELKATAVSGATGIAAVADDTGLFVEALDGAPGIYAARYAGERVTYEQNVAKLLHALEHVRSPRRATFRTAVVLVEPGGRRLVAIGELHGAIARTPSGTGGFGYDPVFIPDDAGGRTLAELDVAEKHALSHRGRALRALASQLAGARACDDAD
ncbi:MAG TPA: RdgB/HAM1 family non-canonical purine NTP pyrophosphatase [Acidimicrobiales bacterium]|jgi:XTP/dITP diphosphohydrolase|nr:RdgB/HAM1 family non-canonical purine NTP pyrophosphatase [Acidimicrobiales bacterium]